MTIHRSTLTVFDPIGLHARPAGQIVKLVNESGLAVRIGKVEDDLVQANSPLRLMALKAKTMDVLILEIESEDTLLATALAEAIQVSLGAKQ